MEVTYINAAGERLTLRQTRPFFLTRAEGIGKTKQTITTFKAPEQDGAFYIASTLDMRNITLEGTLAARDTEEAYDRRARFLQVFSPKSQGTLLCRNKRVSCVVEEAGFVASSRERAPSFFVSLLCPSPFFESLEEIREELAAWMPAFHFALEISSEGISFGNRQPSQIMTLDNPGDVACGCRIVFRALGAVRDPDLTDMSTGQYLRINKTMAAGEEIHVYTGFAGKRVLSVTETSETNAFSFLDTGSVFLQLAPGRNTLRYGAAEQMDLLEVSVYYRPQYLGV